LFLVRNNIQELASKPSPDSANPPVSYPPRFSSSPSCPAKVAFSSSSTTSTSNSGPEHILYVGDSISSNANFNTLEEATETKFIKVKAYSAVHDTEANTVKSAAKFPEANFTDVIPRELNKRKYKHLVVQAGSVDISNLKTKDEPEEHLDYFREETIKSATNLFKAASNALSVQPTLKSVVIMKQIPRYDPSSMDPLALKASLSLLFNNTITRLWTESPLRRRIHIGNHNIDCSGSIRESRYRHTKSGRYDGIHLYGSSGVF
jgi:hypothetical protein